MGPLNKRDCIHFFRKEEDKIMKEFVKSVKEINNNSDFIEFMSKEEDEEKTRNTYFTNSEEIGDKTLG